MGKEKHRQEIPMQMKRYFAKATLGSRFSISAMSASPPADLSTNYCQLARLPRINKT